MSESTRARSPARDDGLNGPRGAATLGEWHKLLRCLVLDKEFGNVARAFASYAGWDGTSIFCGVARLAVDSGIEYSTARRYLADLRSLGLAELVRRGNRHRGLSDEYRLTIPLTANDQLFIVRAGKVAKTIQLLRPDEYEARVVALRETNSAGEKKRRLRSAKASAEPVDEEEICARSWASAEATEGLRSAKASADPEFCARSGGVLRSLMGERTPSTNHLPGTSDLPSPPENPVVTTGTVTREAVPVDDGEVSARPYGEPDQVSA